MARRKDALLFTPGALDTLFQKELQAVNDDVRNKAARAVFKKLKARRRVSVEQFIAALQQHQDMWTAVSSLSIHDFVETLGKRARSAAARTRRVNVNVNASPSTSTSMSTSTSTSEQKHQPKPKSVPVSDKKPPKKKPKEEAPSAQQTLLGF